MLNAGLALPYTRGPHGEEYLKTCDLSMIQELVARWIGKTFPEMTPDEIFNTLDATRREDAPDQELVHELMILLHRAKKAEIDIFMALCERFAELQKLQEEE